MSQWIESKKKIIIKKKQTFQRNENNKIKYQPKSTQKAQTYVGAKIKFLEELLKSKKKVNKHKTRYYKVMTNSAASNANIPLDSIIDTSSSSDSDITSTDEDLAGYYILLVYKWVRI